MEITDTAPQCKGIFELHVYKKGVEIEHYVDHNMIMTAARDVLAKLVGGDGYSFTNSEGVRVSEVAEIEKGTHTVGVIKPITMIGVGSGGTGPTASDSKLTDPSRIKYIKSHSYPTSNPGRVTFSFEFETTEANGINIQEFALFTEDGTMFARKVRGVIAKDQDISISGTWTIIF